MVKLPNAVSSLLDLPNPATVVTVNDSGSAQASVVWIERRGDDLAFFCGSDSLKARNLRQRPGVLVLVLDPDREFEPGARCYVRINGTAAVTPMTDTSFPDRLAQRYMGADEFPHPGDYVLVEVTTTKVGGEGPFVGAPDSWGE
jgi:PPOX class probable F420-dependent enzyme